MHQHQRIRLFSSSKLANQLLDDSEELDPELIESVPPQYTSEETEEITPEKLQYLQQLYAQQIENQQTQKEENIEQESDSSQPPPPPPITSQSKLTPKEIQYRQKKVWMSISNTLQGIWENMDSIDKTNIKRIDKVYQKLTKLETLHVKNIQHSLHHIAMLRDEVSTVNSRINYVFQRLSDLEKTAPSEWLEWSVPQYEIPFEDGIYLRSPGYEVGSMIWCIELRWEKDENMQFDNKEHDAEIEYNINPIVDMNRGEDINETNNDNESGSGGEYDRINKGYNRLGVYVSPRSVANWERLSSLKATCEIRVNENDYSDAISIVRENEDNDRAADKVNNNNNKKQQHFSVSGEFLRGKKLTSWGRTIPNGSDYFDKQKINDEISIKLRIVNQTLSYQQFADDHKDTIVSAVISETDMQSMDDNEQKPQFENFNFSDKKSKIHKQKRDDEINDEVQHFMSMPINEFWNIFSEEIESGKSKQGFAINVIAKQCQLDVKLVSIFRKGPMPVIYEQDNENENENKNENSKKRNRRKKKLLNRKVVQSKKWHTIIEHDANNPDFRRKLATFLVKHQYKKQRNLHSKANF